MVSGYKIISSKHEAKAMTIDTNNIIQIRPGMREIWDFIVRSKIISLGEAVKTYLSISCVGNSFHVNHDSLIVFGYHQT